MPPAGHAAVLCRRRPGPRIPCRPPGRPCWRFRRRRPAPNVRPFQPDDHAVPLRRADAPNAFRGDRPSAAGRGCPCFAARCARTAHPSPAVASHGLRRPLHPCARKSPGCCASRMAGTQGRGPRGIWYRTSPAWHGPVGRKTLPAWSGLNAVRPFVPPAGLSLAAVPDAGAFPLAGQTRFPAGAAGPGALPPSTAWRIPSGGNAGTGLRGIRYRTPPHGTAAPAAGFTRRAMPLCDPVCANRPAGGSSPDRETSGRQRGLPEAFVRRQAARNPGRIPVIRRRRCGR